MSSPAEPFDDGLAAFALALVDPAGLGGVRLRARHGPARDAWLAAARRLLPERAPQLRCPATVETGRLLGGLDTAATLAAGRPIIQTGLLASADGGMLLFAMAERLPRRVAAIIADCMDRGMACTERDGLSAVLPTRFLVLALDEGIDDEAPPAILCNRLAFTVELGPDARPAGSPPDRAEISAAHAVLPSVTVPEAIERALAQLSLTIAPRSMRVALQLMRAARAAAALRGAATVSDEDAALALRLVIGAPAVAEMAEALPEQAPPQQSEAGEEAQEPAHEPDLSQAEIILAAAAASLPPDLLEQGKAGAQRNAASSASGRSDETAASARGAAVGLANRPPRPDSRIDLIATLRTAAPWQRIRARNADEPVLPLKVRASDLRYVRRREHVGATAIFAVDASGSAAAARLAETKGAIELLLAECYVRRDEVALVAFRGDRADIILEPTRSLVRAKKTLAGLPGGGPTPLAHGIVATTTLSAALQRRGKRALTVFLTDGRANVSLDGRQGREAASADALAMARRFRALGLRGLVIDTAQRPQAPLAALAAELGAEYVVLPRGGSHRISAELSARLAG